MVSYSSRHDNTANYRIDRMDSVELIKEDMCERALELRAEVAEYMDFAFKMYGGPVTSAVLEFDASLIVVVYDKFGETTPMMQAGDETFIKAWCRAHYAETIRETKAGAVNKDSDIIGGSIHK